jgi:hypothetical protein
MKKLKAASLWCVLSLCDPHPCVAKSFLTTQKLGLKVCIFNFSPKAEAVINTINAFYKCFLTLVSTSLNYTVILESNKVTNV